MFCSECGTKLNDNAKFCFNCGAKVGEVPTKTEDPTSQALSPKETAYVAYMKNEILNSYISDKTIVVEQFYARARFYDLDEIQVNRVYQCVLEEIEKFTRYINELYKECKEVFLSEDLVEELIRYGEANGISEDTSVSFLEHYNCKNELAEKREILVLLLEEFAETGELDVLLDKKYTDLKTISVDELLLNYKNEITKIMDEMDKYYAQLEEGDYLTDEQRSLIAKKAETMVFIADDVENLILGYEKKRGIYDLRNRLRVEKVYSQFNESFSEKYTFCGQDLFFGAKYFVLDIATKLSYKASERCLHDLYMLDFKALDVCTDIEEVYGDYAEELEKDIRDMEKLLAFSLNTALVEKIDNTLNIIWDKIGELSLTFEEIEQDKKLSKEERERRKALRGRWQGGGFSVGGAIKGAVTARAMNVATGIVHSGVNLVGNAISSIAANSSRKKAVRQFCESAEESMYDISQELKTAFMQEVKIHYPDLDYCPDYHDSEEEAVARTRLLFDAKGELVSPLLKTNPYNPLNAFAVLFYSMQNSEEWNKESEATFFVMERRFHWLKNLEKLDEECINKMESILKNEPEDSISDISVIKTGAEILCILELIDEEKKEFEEFREIYAQLLEKQEYIEWLEVIEMADSQQIVKRGNQYCQDTEYSKAKNTFIRGVRNNEKAVRIIELFFSESDKEEMIVTLEQLVKSKEGMDQEDYRFVLSILGGMINQEGKSLLVYTAEARQHSLVDELLKHGADVELLNQLIGKTDEESSTEKEVVCKSCGKKLSSKAKFCNYCGQKL